MKDFTQEELKKLLYQNQYNNSYSKYNSNEFIGKEILGVKILCFVSANKEIGIDYPSFICKCFCGKLFLRGCQLILKSNNISCGHCNDKVKEVVSKYDNYKDIPQGVLKILVSQTVYNITNSKYSDNEERVVDKVKILKFLPSLRESWPPLFICRCLVCQRLFIASASHVMRGKYKTCGMKGCRTQTKKIEILPRNKSEKKEYMKNGFKFIGVLENKKGKDIKSLCIHCNKYQDIPYEDWINPYKELVCRNCVCLKDIEEQLINNGVDKCFLTHNLEDYTKYKYLLHKHKKYLYMGKGRISKGIQYVWVHCRDCGYAMEIDGEDFLNDKIVEECICFKPELNIAEEKIVDLFSVVDGYVKYSNEKIGIKIGTDILLGKGEKASTVRVKCDKCGKEREVDEEEYFNKRTNYYNACSCQGRKEIAYLKGEIFGHLTLIDENEDTFKFKCDCGNVVSYDKSYFKRHRIQTCGKKCKLNKFSSIYSGVENIGRKFKSLTVEYILQRLTFQSNIPSGVYWGCKCDKCGTISSFNASSLVNGNNSLCECELHKYLYNYPIGSKVNGVKILDILTIPKKEKGIIWQCECPFCGDMFVRDPNSIVTGHCNSCGCLSLSKGEAIIENFLLDLQQKFSIIYNMQYFFEDLKDKGYLYFDFRVVGNGKEVLIEFDGEQHEKPNIPNVRDKEEALQIFQGIQRRDKMKNEYAISHKIPLLRIKYTLNNEKIKERVYKFLKEEGVI